MTLDQPAGDREPAGSGGLRGRDPRHGRPDINLAERLHEAQQALLRRHRLSIRLRLVTSLSLCLLLILWIADSGPLALVAFLLALFALITFFFTQALNAPIRRFAGYTGRIAGGDFSFIPPARRYRDEFTDLAVAVNQMLAELRAQQDRMVQGAKLAAMGTLTSGIAHELNNPLNNIAITAEALMEGLPKLGEEEKWRHLQDIYFETERASEIVKSLLDFTRQEKPEMVSSRSGRRRAVDLPAASKRDDAQRRQSSL